MSKYKKEKDKLYKIIENAEKELDKIIKKEKEESKAKIKIGGYYSSGDGISYTTSYKILKLEPVVLAFGVTIGDFVSIETEVLLDKNLVKRLTPITDKKFNDDFKDALDAITILSHTI